MIRNYFKIAFRNLFLNKAYTFINLLGLGIAIGSSILLFLTSYFEFTFDSVHKNSDKIYKVYFKVNDPEKVKYSTAMAVPMKSAFMLEKKSDIAFATRILDSYTMINFKEKSINNSVNYIDADFFKMFSINFLKGNSQDALSNLNSVILNEEIATKIFGTQEPMGQTIELNLDGLKKPFTVTGITQKSPDNTGIENEIFVRFENHIDYQGYLSRWNASNHDIYIQLKEGVNWQKFELSLKPFTKKYFTERNQQLIQDGAKPDERGEVSSTRLLPLKEVHFDKKIGGGQAVNIIYPYTLLIISILILLIASINFVNLSIARALSRAKEVGMRKALGAYKSQIVGQFWGEAILVCTTAMFLGLLIAFALLPYYNALFVSKVSLSYLINPTLLGTIALVFVLITVIAGGYPAWFISKVNTIQVLKGKLNISGGSAGVRNLLIITQFTFSVLLISCTIVIWQQLGYLQNKPLGFEQNNVVSIPVGSEMDGRKMVNLLRRKLSSNPNILSVSAADNNLGRGKDGSGFKSMFGFVQEGKSYNTNGLYTDFDYLQTLGIQLKEGRDFSRNFPSDSSESCIINESMANQLGGKNLIGKRMMIGDNGKIIIGIIKDYHFESLKNKIDAMTLMVKGFSYNYIFVKIGPNNQDVTLSALSKSYKELAPKSDYLGTFLDENRANQYKKEKRFSQIFIYAAFLAIFLSCMGLLAISIMMISKRTKEIGIRKVLGASVLSISALLSKEYVKLVFISFLLSAPIAYYLMTLWLGDFVYRITLSWWYFAISGIIAIVIALLTISYQSIKAAIQNPVKSLKTE